ncbi:MAG TPA: translation initiation factor IF-2 N-terminal domain-containing protein, partial [Solirubrobacteraceae bacterium]
MNKRVHEIAKERGMAPKELLERLQGAGIEVKAVSSSVDEAVASRVLGNGDGAARTAPTAAAAQASPRE